MDLQSIIENYGYAAIFIGTFLEGETILVLAGLAAHQGYLVLAWLSIFTVAADDGLNILQIVDDLLSLPQNRPPS